MTVEEDWSVAGRRQRRCARDGQARNDRLTARARSRAMALSNDAKHDRRRRCVGDPTEVALFTRAPRRGYVASGPGERYPRLAELPFDSDRKLMTTVHAALEGGRYVAFTKGAGSRVAVSRPGQSRRFAVRWIATRCWPDRRADGRRRAARAGVRDAAASMRPPPTSPEPLTTELGPRVVGLMDPPRQEAKVAVAVCARPASCRS